ncbi:hypothetical protein [Streptomyces davaonensis]|uniref:hypothetical protein n=1 Tax=Streptomyces davaonensis TaxID=348043 RepID=UPI000347B869|nr:hypothetical protein [Streptomyces davaonensis]
MRLRESPRRFDVPPPPPIRGLSSRAGLAVHRYEELSDDYDVFPTVTGVALRRYRDFLSPPGNRTRYPYGDDCGCRGCSLRDVRHARDVLDTVLRNLGPRDRAELARIVAVLDARYRARTLPDPLADPERRWWYRRLPGCPFTQSGTD